MKELTVWRGKQHRAALQGLILAIGSLLSLSSDQEKANCHNKLGKHLDSEKLVKFEVIIEICQVRNRWDFNSRGSTYLCVFVAYLGHQDSICLSSSS